MSNVVNIGCVTKLDLPIDTVLEGAKDKLDAVVIIGYTKDGDEYFASTFADGGSVLWLLEKCKKQLLKVGDDAELNR